MRRQYAWLSWRLGARREGGSKLAFLRIRTARPVNSWRSFFHEILVIVIGVLIALALGAVVEELNWRKRADEGIGLLRGELATNAGLAAEQIIVTPCILAQLDTIREHLVSGETRPLPLDRYPNNLAVLRLPTRPYMRSIWLALQQDGTTTHFSPVQQRYLGNFYSYVETLTLVSLESGNASGRMLLLGYPGTVSDQTRSDLLQVVGEQYRRAQSSSRIAGQMLGSLRDIGLSPSPQDIEDRVRRASNSASSNTVGFCRERGLPLADWQTVLAKVPHITQRPI